MAHADESIDHEEGIGPQEIDAGPVSVVVVFGAVTTVALVFMTIMFFNYMQNVILETKGLDEPNLKVVSTISEQRKQLEGGGVVDPQKGLVAVPIGTAMAMLVEQRKKDPNPKIAPVAPQSAKPANPDQNKDAAKGASAAAKSDPTGKAAVDEAKAAEAKNAKKEPARSGEANSKKEAPKSGAKKGDEKH